MLSGPSYLSLTFRLCVMETVLFPIFVSFPEFFSRLIAFCQGHMLEFAHQLAVSIVFSVGSLERKALRLEQRSVFCKARP